MVGCIVAIGYAEVGLEHHHVLLLLKPRELAESFNRQKDKLGAFAHERKYGCRLRSGLYGTVRMARLREATANPSNGDVEAV